KYATSLIPISRYAITCCASDGKRHCCLRLAHSSVELSLGAAHSIIMRYIVMVTMLVWLFKFGMICSICTEQRSKLANLQDQIFAKATLRFRSFLHCRMKLFVSLSFRRLKESIPRVTVRIRAKPFITFVEAREASLQMSWPIVILQKH